MKQLLFKVIFLILFLNLFSQEKNIVSPHLADSINTLTKKIKLKEISRIIPSEAQSFTGIGIVAGLSGKGDSLKDIKTKEIISKILLENGIDLEEISSKNIALVSISMKIRGNLIKGSSKNIYIASLLDSKDLNGGILLKSKIKDTSGNIIAYASGPLEMKKNIKGSAYVKNGAIINKNQNLGSKYYLIFNEYSYELIEEISKILNDIKIKNKVKSDSIIELDINEIGILSKIENIEIDTLDIFKKVFINEKAKIISSNDDIEIGPLTFFLDKEEDAKLLQNSSQSLKIKIPKMKLNEFILKNSDSLKNEDIIKIIKAAKKINKLNGKLIIKDS